MVCISVSSQIKQITLSIAVNSDYDHFIGNNYLRSQRGNIEDRHAGSCLCCMLNLNDMSLVKEKHTLRLPGEISLIGEGGGICCDSNSNINSPIHFSSVFVLFFGGRTLAYQHLHSA